MSDVNLDDILAKHSQLEDYSKPSAQSSFDSLLDRLDSELFSMGPARRPEKSVTTVSPVLDSLRDEIASLKDIAAGSAPIDMPVQVPENLPEVEIELPSLKDYRFSSRERIAAFQSQTDAEKTQAEAANAAPRPEVHSSLIPKQVDTSNPLDSFTPEAIKRFMTQTDVLFDASGEVLDPSERPATLNPKPDLTSENVYNEDIHKTAPLNFAGATPGLPGPEFDQIAPTQVLCPVQVVGIDDFGNTPHFNAPVAVPGDDDLTLPNVRAGVQTRMNDVAAQMPTVNSPVLVPDDVLNDHLVTNNAIALDTSTVFAPTSVPPSDNDGDQAELYTRAQLVGSGAPNIQPSVQPDAQYHQGAQNMPNQSILGQSSGEPQSPSLAKLTAEPKAQDPALQELEEEKRLPNRMNYILAASLVLFVIVGIVAAVVFFTSNKPEAISDQAQQEQQDAENDSNQLVKRQAPLFFTGGHGYVIFVDPNTPISKLKFNSNMETGSFDIRNTTVSKPLSGEVLASGDFAKNNEVTFSEQKFNTIVIVFKDVPANDKTRVQITNVSVE